MKSLLIHGCYDSATLDTLKSKGIKEFSFDLRGRSSNLIPFRDLKVLLQEIPLARIFLTFENDKKETILSFLNLLSDLPFNFTLVFRDVRDASFYEELGKPFFWMFNPAANWKEIIEVETIKGVLLPLKYQLHYQRMPDFWEMIEKKHLDVYLHAETFEETAFIKADDEMKLSIDLGQEVEESFRKINQNKLNQMKIWRPFNENPAGQ
jgi:hypothetical protein